MRGRGGWIVRTPTSTRLYRAGRLRRRGRGMLHSGGFRMVELNAAGWAALLVPGLVAGGAIAWIADAPVAVGIVAGAIAAYGVGLVVDGRRWRRSPVSVQCPDVPVEVLERVVAGLRADGAEATLEMFFDLGPQGPATFCIVTRQRDLDAVQQALLSA